jgi:multiple sugar transport system ATP-binding protein
VPELQEEGAHGPLALGARPEHVTLADDGAIRGQVFGAEYLGTTQIVTLDTHHGQIKARLPASMEVRLGENVGLRFHTARLAMFDAASGRALRSALHEGATHG